MKSFLSSSPMKVSAWSESLSASSKNFEEEMKKAVWIED